MTLLNFLEQTIFNFENTTNSRVIYLTKSGSKLYGTDHKDSDTDFVGLFLPSLEDVLLKKDIPHFKNDTNPTKEKNSKDDIDFILYNVYTFFNNLKKSETGAVDLLFSMFAEEQLIVTGESNLIKENYKIFLNKNMKAFIGYAVGQARRFGIKGDRYNDLEEFSKFVDILPNSEETLGDYFMAMKDYIKTNKFKYIKFVIASGSRGNEIGNEVEYVSILGKMFEGRVSVSYFKERFKQFFNQFGNRTKTIAKTAEKVDFKAFSHAIRIVMEVSELLKTNFIKFPLTNAQFLLEIKLGKYNQEFLEKTLAREMDKVDSLLLESKLPEEPNEDEVNKLLLELIKN
jgi:predicted nucleotidyltransferase